MKVINIHQRIINQPKENVAILFETLSKKDDKIWPFEKWPSMKFKDGLKIGSKGGHGPVRYTIVEFVKGAFIKFQFSKPDGFNGFHQLEIRELEKNKTEIKHTIDMKTTGIGIITWMLAIRSLHNALLEDAFDKVENHFSKENKETAWNIWVKILRSSFKSSKKQKLEVLK